MLKFKNQILEKNKWLLAFMVIITVIHVVYASLSQRGAYLDGAMQELFLFSKMGMNKFAIFTDPTHTRFFINAISQLPMLLAHYVFGINSKYWLSVIFSLPLFLFPPLLLWWNYKLSHRTKRYDIFFISFLVYAGITLPISIFSIVEILIGVFLQFILLNYLAGKIDYTKRDICIIILLILSLFGTYEYVVFLGVIIFIASIFYSNNENNPKNKKIKRLIGQGGLISSLSIFIFFIMNMKSTNEGFRFISEAEGLWSSIFYLNFVLTILAAVITIIALYKKDYFTAKFKVIVAVPFIAVVVYMMINLDTYINPMMAGHLRTIPCWLVPALFIAIFLRDLLKKRRTEQAYSNIFTIALMLCISQTLWQINNTYWWNKNIEYIQNELSNSKSLLYFPDEHEEISSFFNEKYRRYVWNFSYAATSILFSPDYRVKALMLQPTPREDEKGGNLAFKNWLFVENNNLVIPTIVIPKKNKFWDLTEVSQALDEHQKKEKAE